MTLDLGEMLMQLSVRFKMLTSFSIKSANYSGYKLEIFDSSNKRERE